jgi:type II secretory pathway pseudopilin PulG
MKSQLGFTIIEMTIYIGIVALISSSLTGLYINIIKLKSNATNIQEVNESVRLASAKIGHEIRQAKSINGVGTSLSLAFAESARNPTIFALSNGRIRMTVGTSIAYITSNLVNIGTFSLTNLSSGDSLAQNIRFTIVGTYLGNEATITNSSEVRSK